MTATFAAAIAALSELQHSEFEAALYTRISLWDDTTEVKDEWLYNLKDSASSNPYHETNNQIRRLWMPTECIVEQDMGKPSDSTIFVVTDEERQQSDKIANRPEKLMNPNNNAAQWSTFISNIVSEGPEKAITTLTHIL